MTIKLFNSLSKEKEEFIPQDPKNITIYVCGPTVYSFPHLGNARSVVIYDLLFRLFLKNFEKVTYVRNITDVDDKINNAAKKREISIKELTKEFIDIFHHDMAKLHVLKPTIEPKATENIDQMITMIENLIKNGNAYEVHGHVLFDVTSYEKYGKLSNRNLDDMIAGARIEEASYKRNPLDFVLWKPASENDDESAIFESPWGQGRPGWHIECSAMSNKFLGQDFDIHGGGADLKFPHHDNEIAQSICAHKGSNHAKYWVHNGFLTVNGEKMSKSLGNFITVRDLLDKDIAGIVIRYLLLISHYRKPLDFSDHALEVAQKAIDKFYDIIKEFEGEFDESKIQKNPYLDEIKQALSDDLNSPVAFAVLHKATKDVKKEQNSVKKEQLILNLIQSLDFLGLYEADYVNNLQISNEVEESYILEQIELRKQAKKDKNWGLCDKIRDDLLSNYNVILKDNPDGSVDWEIK